MTIKFANNAVSTLAGSLSNSATSLVLAAGTGAKFPALGAGDYFMLTLIKMVSGSPVIEIVKVTARATDTCTIVRGQESTTATTFSAGDRAEHRLTSGAMDALGQKDFDNTWAGVNTFNGVTNVANVAAGDNSNKAAYTGWVRGYAAAKGANSDITSLSGLTTALSVAQGGTGATAGPAACVNLGAVQQGTGTGQGTNQVKLGWSTTGGGGLRCTIDSTDIGYFAPSSTNPMSGGTITYANPLTAQAANFTTVTASGALTANLGIQVNGAYTSIQGGAFSTLANNGFMQLGLSSSLNIVMDYSQMQARSNGAATTLNLNPLGGLVQVGSGGLSSSGTITGATVISTGSMQVQSSSNFKIQLMQGATTRGFIVADSTNCFGVINAGNTLQTLSLDNSGNLTAAGNITANSDERLKKNWRDLPEDFLDQLAEIALVGVYDRIDTGETQAGMSAQAVQTICPELVTVGAGGILSLNYGNLGALTGLLLARERKKYRKEIDTMKAQLQSLIEKVGA